MKTGGVFHKQTNLNLVEYIYTYTEVHDGQANKENDRAY